MYEYLIYNQLQKYKNADKAFHMPGHKGRGDFAKLFPVAELDVTELTWSDNLACPNGIIAAAQRDVAEILGAKKSYFLTDGSSSGVMTMIFAVSKRGKKLIVPRGCHQSVWNACRLFGIEPIAVRGKIVEGIMLPPDPEEIRLLLKKYDGISGMIATSPDYYGNVSPLKEYSEILREENCLLLVDGAHGAHLAFDERQKYAGTYADIWVDGAHKTLFTLTQGAVLNLNDNSLIPDVEEGLNIFRTTSPSYPVMASVEYGIKLFANDSSYLSRAREAAQTLKSDKFFTVYSSDDWAKLAIDCKPFGISADFAAEELENRGINCEFSDGRYILVYLSPAVTADDMRRLIEVLKSVLCDSRLKNSYRTRDLEIPASKNFGFQYALNCPHEWIALDNSVGRICAQNTGITPPCIPVCVIGELITDGAVRTLKSGKTFGLSQGRIKVVK